jgi:hypothetical protein
VTERRRGGETGVESVRCLSGRAAWEAEGLGPSLRELADSLLDARRRVRPKVEPISPRADDTIFQIQYSDGLRAGVAMLNSVGECFAAAVQRKGSSQPEGAVFALEPGAPYGHFGYLLKAVEHMVLTRRPAYPVERTLLTTGMLSALLQSKSEGGTTTPTPHLAEFRYRPADWPHAAGALFKPL